MGPCYREPVTGTRPYCSGLRGEDFQPDNARQNQPQTQQTRRVDGILEQQNAQQHGADGAHAGPHILAGILESGWALGLKASHGFTRPLPSLLTVIGMAASFWLLAKAIGFEDAGENDQNPCHDKTPAWGRPLAGFSTACP